MDMLDSSWALGNADLLEQIVLLGWLKGEEGSKKNLENLTQLRVGYEVWQRISGQRELDALRNQTILSISKYVKDNPKASQEQMAKEIGKIIQQFAQKVEQL